MASFFHSILNSFFSPQSYKTTFNSFFIIFFFFFTSTCLLRRVEAQVECLTLYLTHSLAVSLYTFIYAIVKWFFLRKMFHFFTIQYLKNWKNSLKVCRQSAFFGRKRGFEVSRSLINFNIVCITIAQHWNDQFKYHSNRTVSYRHWVIKSTI